MINKELYKREGNNIYIKNPSIEELSFVENLWGNIKNMNNIGGTYYFPKEKWTMFYKKMIYPTDGKNFYCLIYNYYNEPVGEVSFHGYNSATKVARINVKIDYKYRRLGYAKEALVLLLEYYFWDFGGETIIDSANNEPSNNLLEGLGFEVINKFKDQITYKLEKNKFSLYKKEKNKVINILAYDDMDIMDYCLIFKIFSDANKYLKEEYFRIKTLSFKEEIIIENKIKIKIDKNLDFSNYETGVIVIPNSNKNDLNLEEKRFSEYIKKSYRNLDNIIVFDKGRDIIKNILSENIDFNKNEYEINGKVITAFSYKEKIKGCINIIRKNLGEEVSQNLLKEIL